MSIDFTSEGSKQFQEITRELYRTGLLKQTPQTFAIVLDNVMESDPMIDYTTPDLRDGISGGAEISGGNMTVQESKDLAFVLNTGALPVKLETAYQQQVSATLGKDSLNQGLIAGLVGLGLVLSTCCSTTASSGWSPTSRSSCTASCSGGCSTSSP